MRAEIEVKDFNLRDIFDCGQCFRWNREEDGSYTGVAFGRAVNITMRAGRTGFCAGCPRSGRCRGTGFCGTLILEGADPDEFQEIWAPYFDLKRDYGQIKAALAEKDPVMAQAIKHGEGIRILNQDPWETLISFIISQNNNIPRIKRCIEDISAAFGEEIGEYRGKKRYGFPSFDRLAELAPEDLGPVRLGYRARYIAETARAAAADGGKALYSIRDMEQEEAFRYLSGLCGVGPKVANCILLFAGEKYGSFPVDVWVKRVMNRLYGIDEQNVKEMQSFAAEKFGELGGFAQQYLFYYMRELEK